MPSLLPQRGPCLADPLLKLRTFRIFSEADQNCHKDYSQSACQPQPWMRTLAAIAKYRQEALMSASSNLLNLSTPDRFFVRMAAICFFIPVLAFAPTYYLQLPAGTVVGTRGLHLHALVFTAWPAFFLLQTWFAATGRLRRHRSWGMAGIALGTVLILSGVASTIRQLDANLAAGYGEAARSFAIVPSTQVLLFSILFAAAIAKGAKPDFHKRLMLMATVILMPAALVRIPFALIVGIGPGLRPGNGVAPPPVVMPVIVAVVVDLIIVAAILHDWRAQRRLHPAYVVGGAVIVAIHLLIVPLSHTSAWRTITDWLLGFA
jgi:hypothetical protein